MPTFDEIIAGTAWTISALAVLLSTIGCFGPWVKIQQEMIQTTTRTTTTMTTTSPTTTTTMSTTSSTSPTTTNTSTTEKDANFVLQALTEQTNNSTIIFDLFNPNPYFKNTQIMNMYTSPTYNQEPWDTKPDPEDSTSEFRTRHIIVTRFFHAASLFLSLAAAVALAVAFVWPKKIKVIAIVTILLQSTANVFIIIALAVFDTIVNRDREERHNLDGWGVGLVILAFLLHAVCITLGVAMYVLGSTTARPSWVSALEQTVPDWSTWGDFK